MTVDTWPFTSLPLYHRVGVAFHYLVGLFLFFCFFFFVFFFFFLVHHFLSYIYFLYFPDDFCMLLLLSVSTVTARVSSRRFPGNGKLCTHGIIFEWPPLPPHPIRPDKIKCTQHTNEGLLDWRGLDWLTERIWLANPVIDWGGGEWNVNYEISHWPHGIIKATCITECTASICKCNNYDYHFLCLHSNHLSNCIKHIIPELYPAWFSFSSSVWRHIVLSFLCVMCQPVAAFLHLSGTACWSMSAVLAFLERG